jgi:hypothetical protein
VFCSLINVLKSNGCLMRRVMTVSFHKYGELFFPGTGDVKVRICTGHLPKGITGVMTIEVLLCLGFK